SNVYNAQLENAGGIVKNDGTVLKQGEKDYNKEILGLEYKKDAAGNETDFFANPNASKQKPSPAELVDEGLTCDGGTPPDPSGCCPGETFTDMGEEGWNCCPDAGGDCFPPIAM
ncbi:MAG: hypothetical protein LBL21_00480, partial [Rickettsiales bacterium]|nr:hypothetical protein [Rickettsiales bacterium]